MPLLIAFGLGNSDVTEVDISVKMPQESGSAPLLAIVGNGIFFNIPAHDEDYWRLQDNTLKLFFHGKFCRSFNPQVIQEEQSHLPNLVEELLLRGFTIPRIISSPQ